jgi:hypothetical protein
MSVAIVAFFCVSVSETLVGHPVFEASRPFAAGVLVAAGVASWFIGRFLATRRLLRQEESRFVLFDFRYWGPMFVTLGVITLFIRPIRTADVKPAIAAAPPKPPTPVAVAVVKQPEPEPIPPKPVVFPDMKVQGVIIRQAAPYAIINGQSYTVGDHLGDVVVRDIKRSSVMVELSGELKVLPFD